jgi:hypothetical protein
MVHDKGIPPERATRPYVGFKPIRPHRAAGNRIDPPVSEPSVKGQIFIAIATADPLLEPPTIRVGFQGLRQSPKCGFSPVKPKAHSC